MLRDGEVPEGRTEAAVVQKTPYGAGHSALESLQGATDFVDGIYRHERTIRPPNQNGGNIIRRGSLNHYSSHRR